MLIDTMPENGALAESPYGGSKNLPPCSCNFEIMFATDRTMQHECKDCREFPLQKT